MRVEPGIEKSSLPRDLLKGLLYGLWQVIRLPTLAVLTILEPFVSFLLIGFAAALVLVSFVFRFASTLQHYPFWGMLGVAVACLLALALFRGLIALLAR